MLFGLILAGFLSVSVCEAQKPTISPTLQVANEDEGFEWGIPTDLININVWVWSSKKGYLTDLTADNFVIYDKKVRQKIEFCLFNEPTNQYHVSFYPNVTVPDDTWHDVKVKVKLSAEKKKEYGKIFVRATNGYYSKQS